MGNGQKQLRGPQVEAVNQIPHKAITHTNRNINVCPSPLLFR